MEINFKERLLRTVVLITLCFTAIIVIILLALNLYFPKILLNRYIDRSRELANRLSKSIQNVRIVSKRQRMIKRIVKLNFPEEENILHIVVRDKSGKTTYQKKGQSRELSFAELLDRKNRTVEENTQDARIKLIRHQTKNRSVMYYKISAPIYRGGHKVGDVAVGISKRILFNKIELNKSQLSRIVFVSSILIVVLLTFSFFFSMRFFVKFKQSEEQAVALKRLAYIGEISSGLAHEIRNPLNTMSINLQLLRENFHKGDNANVEKKIKVLEDAKAHAADVLTKFMNFARYKKNRVPVEFNLVDTAQEVVGMVEDQLSANKIAFSFEPGKKNIALMGEPGEFKQVLLNLILNSIEAVAKSKDKQITVLFETKKNNLSIIVKDNGPGMDSFTLDNIYTPFFSKKKKGSGLGLAVVRRIVDEYGGDIQCQSEVNKGTTFTIHLQGVVIS